MPYCFPSYWPALTMNGFRCLKFEISDGSHGCTRPLVAKYFTQPTYGRKRSGLSTRVDLRERVRLVRHVRELRLVRGVRLHVRREHRLAAVVAVAGPVEHLQAAASRPSRSRASRRRCRCGPRRGRLRRSPRRSLSSVWRSNRCSSSSSSLLHCVLLPSSSSGD